MGRERGGGLSLTGIDSVGVTGRGNGDGARVICLGMKNCVALHFARYVPSRGRSVCFYAHLYHALGIWYLPMNSSTESCGGFVSHMLHITPPAGR